MTRREWLALCGMAVAGGCAPKKGAGYPGYALIATSGDNSLSAVDLSDFKLAKTIRLNAPPTAVVPAAGTRVNYVLTPSNGSLHIVDEHLNVVASKRLADELSEVRLMPGGKELMAIPAHGRELILADAERLSVLRRYRLNAGPVALEVSEAGCAAVSTGEYGSVELVDTATGRHYETALQAPLGQLRFRGDGKLLLTANLGSNALTALTVPGLQVIADLALAMRPENLCFNFDQGQLFVSGPGMDAVAIVFPYNTLEVDQTVLAGRQPGVMACSESPQYLFVASDSGSGVWILNVDSRKLVGLVQAGQKPSYIVVTPDSQYALVLDESSGDMAVIHIPEIQTNRSKSGVMPGWASVSVPLFAMLSVGDRPVHAAVVPRAV